MMMAYSYVAAAASSMSLESRKSYLAYVYACLDRSMDRVQCNAVQAAPGQQDERWNLRPWVLPACNCIIQLGTCWAVHPARQATIINLDLLSRSVYVLLVQTLHFFPPACFSRSFISATLFSPCFLHYIIFRSVKLVEKHIFAPGVGVCVCFSFCHTWF